MILLQRDTVALMNIHAKTLESDATNLCCKELHSLVEILSSIGR